MKNGGERSEDLEETIHVCNGAILYDAIEEEFEERQNKGHVLYGL